MKAGLTPGRAFFGFAVLISILFLVYEFGFNRGRKDHLDANKDVPLIALGEASPEPKTESESTTENPAEQKDESELELPNIEEYRKEGAENPHQTPRTLINFAHALADHMEAAQASHTEATKLFSALENCVQGAELPQARAICFVNAGRLTEKWSEFDKRYEKLQQGLPEDVRTLVQALD